MANVKRRTALFAGVMSLFAPRKRLTNAAQEPVLTFTGGGGSGSTMTATVVKGAVSSFTITNSGYGYTTVPRITVIG